MCTDNNPLTYVLTGAKLDAASHYWVTNLSNYNFQLHYQARKTNIDVDARLRVSWLGCMPDDSGTHLEVTATTMQAVQEAALEGPCEPHGGLQLQSAFPGCSLGQSVGHLYDLRGLASSPRSGPHPDSSHH